MPNLKLHLFGPPRLERDDVLIDIGRRKAVALLSYIATMAKPHSRDTLAVLFWSEYDQNAARADLRRILSVLNKALGSGIIQADRETVQLNLAGQDYDSECDEGLWLDVAEFCYLSAGCPKDAHPSDQICLECLPKLRAAVDLYQGDFLAGFTLKDSPEFDDWQYFTGESHRQSLAATLQKLVHGYTHLGEYDQAITDARFWLTLDPLHEPAHQQLMKLYAWSNQLSSARRQYEQCVQILEDELGVLPSKETTVLYTAIQAGQLQPPESPTPTADSRGGHATYADGTETAQAVSENELRLVTVLCAGVVEGESLLSISPERTAMQVDSLTKLLSSILDRYEAQLELPIGDNVLAIFGMERVHEDDPERALRGAFDLLQLAQDANIDIAVGVASGAVHIGQAATQPRAQPRDQIAGPVVTLAIRLQNRAATGEVLVSSQLRQRTHHAFRLEPTDIRIRGISGTVYQLIHPRYHPRKTRGIEGLQAELIGRDAELSQLQQRVQHIQNGKGQIVCLIGDAGVGKSRLASELYANMVHSKRHNTDLLWLEGRCQEMGMATSYWPFIDILHSYLGWQFGDDEITIAARIVETLDKLTAHGHLTSEQRNEVGPLLGNLLSVHFETEWDKRLRFADPEQLRHRTLMGLRDLFCAISRQQPVILVLEDLHWSDTLTLDLIGLLMEELPTSALLVLCVYRNQRGHRCLQLATQGRQKCATRFVEIHLHELMPEQTRHMIGSLLTIDNLPDNVQETILQKSGGNPLFVEEVVRSLMDGGLVKQDGQVWHASQQIAHLVVPETVQSVVLARLDRLAVELKEVLQRAAIVGRIFGERLMSHLLPSNQNLASAMTTLTEHGFIYQERAVPDVEYSFKHILVQEAVYQTTLEEQREKYHRQVAEAMEQLYADHVDEVAEQLAYHYERSGIAPEVVEKAITYLLRSGEKARRGYLNEEAVGYYQRVQELIDRLEGIGGMLEHADWQPWRLETLHKLGQIYLGMGKLNSAEDNLRYAITLGRRANIPLPKLIRLYFLLGEVLFWSDQHDEKIKLGEEGLSLLSCERNSVESVLMTDVVAIGHNEIGNYDVAYKLLLEISKILPRLPYIEELRPVYMHVMLAYVQSENNAIEAIECAQALEKMAEQNHDLRAIAAAFLQSGEHIYCDLGDLPNSINYTRRALELFRQIGDTKHECGCLTSLGNFFLRNGELENAESYLLKALDIAEAAYTQKLIYTNLGLVSVCRMAWDKALNSFHLRLQLAQVPSQDLWGMECIGWTHLAQGKRAEALKRFQAIFAASKGANTWFFLSALDEAYQDPDGFRDYCQSFYMDQTFETERAFVQWYLDPTESDHRFATEVFGFDNSNIHGLQRQIKNGDWHWQDSYKDCIYLIHDELEIRAANEREIRYVNRSAPRLLHPISGDFAVETICLSNKVGNRQAATPAIGGLLIWQDEHNYLNLIRGRYGRHNICFRGCLANKDFFVGRGRLPSERLILRLEKLGNRVNALTSSDGQHWYTVGYIDFPASNSLHVGLHAIGKIDRLIYPGAFPDGTAIRFESFRLLQPDPAIQ